tara:strand:+ start:23493 stop:23906 length:414 start_codon:yes stop_codon:yes gene_type:complete
VPELADFEGDWRIERSVRNAMGEDAHFAGVAAFTPAPGGLRLTEAGEMRIGTQGFHAERRYLWQQVDNLIHVRFDDGRFFHAFDARTVTPAAHHDCAPDVYRVHYDFSAWPTWRAEWHVRGPRKDYRMCSRYFRDAA